ncbi:hypothetical protein QZH41_013058 [Actinostola sp. cb2023]|nr:hypothetical protein QZH41_013058 [Actinostola sp. cb2023]
MAGFPYHMEALRKERIIERKREALENLARKQEVLEKSRNLETRGGELESRASTRAAISRQASNQVTAQAPRYRYVLPPKAKPLHQWYDLQNNHIHHEARSLDRPYQNERRDGKAKEFWQQA